MNVQKVFGSILESSPFCNFYHRGRQFDPELLGKEVKVVLPQVSAP